jgi:hypothetical protein
MNCKCKPICDEAVNSKPTPHGMVMRTSVPITISPEDVERQVMTNHFQSACTFGETFNLGPRALIEVLSTTVLVCFVFDHATLSRAAVLTFLVLIRFCEIVNNL